MLRRAARLFRRYAELHIVREWRGIPLQGSGGPVRGYIDRLRTGDGRVQVVAWTDAAHVTLMRGADQAETHPDIPRPDTPEGGRGFEVDLPLGEGPLRLVLRDGGARTEVPLPDLRGPVPLRERLRVAVAFVRDLMRAAPLILRWLFSRDPGLRPRIRAALQLDVEPASASFDMALFGPPVLAPAQDEITIVLPVYNAFDLLPEVLDRVLRNTDLPWHLVVIDDASPDPAVRPWLRDWVAALPEGRATLLENDTNLGFIRSVNRALEVAIARGRHVVLLNSDAFLPEAWASRLLAPLADPGVATVTPMANDAEIFTVPVICRRTVLRPGQGDAIDATARDLALGEGMAEAPTGVGFCMAMSVDYLRRLPTLDTIFGRGYGEEVDWCQRARALGGRHLGLPSLFVEHRGGESFGSAEKLRLIQANNRIVAERYPYYDAEVQDFLRRDPLSSARIALALAWAGSLGQVIPIYVAHSMGGGAEHYLQRRIAGDLAEGCAIVLRLGGRSRWRIELHSSSGITRTETEDEETMLRLLAPVAQRRIVYSCAVGDRDPVSVPQTLLRIMREGDRTEVLFHDFYPLSPSYTLLGSDGRFHGVPALADPDPAHQTSRPDGSSVTLRQWRDAWGALLERAEELVVFSADSASHVAAAYPGLTDRIQLRPHQAAPVPTVAPAGQTLAVLGNIGLQKGAALLGPLSNSLGRELVVVGNVDPSVPLPASVRVHGSYGVADLPALVKRYRIGAWIVPSIWPETFSFTTHEAIATGLPVFAFDLGAQAEVLHRAANGHVIPFDPADPVPAAARFIRETLDEPQHLHRTAGRVS